MRRYLLIIAFAIFSCSLTAKSTSPNQVRVLLAKAAMLENNHPAQAARLLKQAYQLALQTDKPELCAEALSKYAGCMYQQGDDELSISLYYNALNYCPPNEWELKATIYNGLGMVYQNLNKLEKAEKYMLQALRLARLRKNANLLTSVYSTIANLYAHTSRETKAEAFYNEALILSRTSKDKHTIANILMNLGNIGNNMDKRICSIKEAFKLSCELNDLKKMAKSQTNLAKCYYLQKKYVDALQTLKRSYDYANTARDKQVELENMQLQADIYEAEGQKELAFAYLKQLIEKQDKWDEERHSRQIENKLMSKQLLSLREGNELQKKENESYQERIYLVSAGIVILLIAIFVLIRFYTYKRQKKAELLHQQYELEKSKNQLIEWEMKEKREQLAHANNELNDAKERLNYMQLFLKSRNELLENIRSKIRENYKLDGNEHVTHLKSVINYIAQFQTGKNGKEVPTEAEQESADFIQRLKSNYPKITEVECTLAVYLRANLSTKEIALLTGTQLRTIESNRYRLRKVLALKPEEHIEQYLQQI